MCLYSLKNEFNFDVKIRTLFLVSVRVSQGRASILRGHKNILFQIRSLNVYIMYYINNVYLYNKYENRNDRVGVGSGRVSSINTITQRTKVQTEIGRQGMTESAKIAVSELLAFLGYKFLKKKACNVFVSLDRIRCTGNGHSFGEKMSYISPNSSSRSGSNLDKDF